jgi:hypothetical protein
MKQLKKSAEAEAAHQELVANAHKAPELKHQTGPQTNIPEHRTSHERKIKVRNLA